MAVRDRNIHPSNDFIKQVIALPVDVGASINQRLCAAIMPYKGKILAAYFRCESITDGDDSARVKVSVDGTDAVSAAVDPVAADTTTTFTLTTTTFASGARLEGHVLTGAGDALCGTFVFIVRPYVGASERSTQSLAY